MAKNEVAVVNFEVATMESDFLETIKEEMAGLGNMPIDTIKIPSGGGIAFEIPGEDPENPDMAKEIVGVIVAHQPQNSFWLSAYTGGNEPPDCMSPDGKKGIVAATGEVRDCGNCKMNQYGSAVDAQGKATRGKACKNLHRLFVLRAGEMLPVIINIPPTSIKAWKEYLAKRILLKKKKPSQVVTKISLKKAVSNDGITYSQCVFAKASDLDAKTIKSLEPMIYLTKQIMENYAQQITESYAVSPAVEADPYLEKQPTPFEERPIVTRAEAADAQDVFDDVTPIPF